MSIFIKAQTFLLIVLLVFSPQALAKLSEEETNRLESMIEKSPKDALLYIENKLKELDTTSELYLDYLDAKASVLTLRYNEAELLKVIDEGLKLSQTYPDKRYHASFVLYQSILEQTKGDYEKSLSLVEQALSLASISLKGEREDSLILGNIYSAKGRTNYYAGSFEDATNNWKKAYHFFEQGKYEKLKMVIINDLGNLASTLGDFEESIRNFEEVIAYYKKNNMEVAAGPSIFNLGLNYIYTNQPEKAKAYFNDAKSIGEKYNDILTQAHSSQWLGEVEGILKNYERAIIHFKHSLKLFTEVRNQPKVFTIRLKLAELYTLLKSFDLAREFIELAKSQLSSVQLEMAKNEVLRVEGSLFEALGNYQGALDSFKEYHNTFRQYVEDSNQKQLHEMKNKFSSERERTKNKLLEKELALKKVQSESEAKEKQRTQWLLALAMVTIFGLLYLFNKQQKLKKKLAEQALTDELTGAKNRRAIFEKAKEQFEYAKRYQEPLTLGVCDLDHFKNLNDTYGHDIGDKVLKAFAKAGNASIRAVDYFGRIGGEEWLFVFPKTSGEEIAKVAYRINSNLAEAALPVSDVPTFSMGTATLSDSDQQVKDLFKRADEALYKAKDSGRNQVVNF